MTKLKRLIVERCVALLNLAGMVATHSSSAGLRGKGDIPGDTRLTHALSCAGAYDRQTFLA